MSSSWGPRRRRSFKIVTPISHCGHQEEVNICVLYHRSCVPSSSVFLCSTCDKINELDTLGLLYRIKFQSTILIGNTICSTNSNGYPA